MRVRANSERRVEHARQHTKKVQLRGLKQKSVTTLNVSIAAHLVCRSPPPQLQCTFVTLCRHPAAASVRTGRRLAFPPVPKNNCFAMCTSFQRVRAHLQYARVSSPQQPRTLSSPSCYRLKRTSDFHSSRSLLHHSPALCEGRAAATSRSKTGGQGCTVRSSFGNKTSAHLTQRRYMKRMRAAAVIARDVLM
jgi:hypothetical protein